jgi:hypothetical protein
VIEEVDGSDDDDDDGKEPLKVWKLMESRLPTAAKLATEAQVRPTEIRSTRPLDLGRFRVSRIGFWVILPTRRGILWVQGLS